MSRPWFNVGLLILAGSVVTLVVLLSVLGEQGFPRGPDGKAANGPITFAVLAVFGLLIGVVGASGVVTGKAFSASDDREFTGTKARVVGGLQCLGAALLIGASLYGLLFNE